MGEAEQGQGGPVTQFLTEDHRRLEALLQAARADPERVNCSAYDEFRAGLLRHIGMEEKILLPAAQRLRAGQPLPLAAKLRLDHGALASLLMPTPSASIIAMIRGILADHNVLEEGPAGLYQTCDELAVSEADRLLANLHAAPTVRVMPYSDTPAVMNTVQRALARAGYHF